MADFGGEDLEGFRTEAKAWLDENFPKALAADPAAQMAAMDGAKESDDARLWRERIGAKGWG
ncbi:MAG: acyl-CoA dehydrogenase, partial [Phenylobacterium sp.]